MHFRDIAPKMVVTWLSQPNGFEFEKAWSEDQMPSFMKIGQNIGAFAPAVPF